MTSELSRYLSDGSSRHASLSPEKLELLGKEAANLFLDKKLPLNEGVAKLAAAYDDINAEQVQRVCEFANTAVFLAHHEKNKTAGSEHSYPQFPLADPHTVLHAIGHGSRPTEVTKTDLAYSRQPEQAKVASVKTEQAFAEMFHADQVEKVAHSLDSGVHDLMTVKENLTDLKASLEHTGEQFDLHQKQASAEYYDVVKRHLLDGGSFADVLRAASETGADTEKVATVLRPVIVQLLEEKVASSQQLFEEVDDLQKVACREVDQDHELVRLFGAVASFDDEVEKVATALLTIDDQLVEVNRVIKESFLDAR